MMKAGVQEHDDHYEVDIDLPGFKKEELSLELKDGKEGWENLLAGTSAPAYCLK